MTNRSYRIGYNFQNRVKKYLQGKGWNSIAHPKSSFPDLMCWKGDSSILVSQFKEEETQIRYKVIFVECKVNKYLTKEEKEKAAEIIKTMKCNNFYVAYRKGKKLLFYEFFENKTTEEVEL